MPIPTEPRLESYRDPVVEEVYHQPMVELFTRMHSLQLFDQIAETAGLSSSTISRVNNGDPTVSYRSRVKIWRAANFLIDLQEWNSQQLVAGVRKPLAPVSQPELAVFDALWLSLRTIPCRGALHVYGRPYDPGLYPRILMASEGQIDDEMLRRLSLMWSVCPLNRTSRHIPDDILSELAVRVGLTHNVWRDPLTQQESAVVE
jgi:hypothetical protein